MNQLLMLVAFVVSSSRITRDKLHCSFPRNNRVPFRNKPIAMSSSTSPSSDDVILLDGSTGEGGGQLLRNAISYAAILGLQLKVNNIRAGRSKPGLAAQHVTGLRLATQICGGLLEGDTIGSQTIRYTPPSPEKSQLQKKQSGNERTLIGDIGTAGSICLLLQVALPCALFKSVTPCKLKLRGGTNASMAPQYDYWDHVFWAMVQPRFNLPLIEHKVLKRGYFPRGGGEVQVRTDPVYPQQEGQQVPKSIPPLVLTDRGNVCELYIRSHHAGKLPKYVAIDMAKAAKSILSEKVSRSIIPKVDIVTETQAQGSGSGIIIVAKTSTGCLLAGSALGSPKKRAKDVGKEAALELASTLQDGGCVDEWLQDQLILFMALADGTSELLTGSLTLHTKTAIWVAQELCGAKFTITKASSSSSDDTGGDNKQSSSAAIYGKGGRDSGKHLIRCEGISYVNPAYRNEDV